MKDDAISRQRVLKLLSAIPPEEAITKAMLIQNVKYMSAAQPERKRGKWKMYLKRHVFVCSICGAWQVFNCNYCPNCGTDMREVSE